MARGTREPCAQTTVTRHELAIRMLVNSDAGVHRNGLSVALAALVEEVDATPDCSPLRCRPDAYKIDRSSKTIVLFEVEDTNPITAGKLAELAAFWMAWDDDDYDDWTVELHTVDRYGRVTGQIDLCAVHYGFAVAA
jgi:hypothetical protein